MISTAYFAKTLTDLVRINSVNPSLESGGKGEQEIAEYIYDSLLSFDFEASIETIAPGRCNVIGKLKGKGSGKSLMLNAHMDTVGIEGMTDPFGATIKGGKLFGRGAYDMKASIAAILGVAKAMHIDRMQPRGDLILTFVADEEFESIGTAELLKNHAADACIVTEPTDLQVCLGHRGFGVYEVTTYGKIAHGGLHREGIDANMKMGKVLSALDTLSNKLADKSHPLFGQASLHVPLVDGGQSLFIYSGKCTANIERRTLPGETEGDVFRSFQSILDDITKTDNNFKAELRQLMWRNPHEIHREAPIAKALINAMPDSKFDFIGHTWWEDSGLFGEAGIDTVIIGPKGGGIHQQVEWVDLDSVGALSQILLKTCINYCNGEKHGK